VATARKRLQSVSWFMKGRQDTHCNPALHAPVLPASSGAKASKSAVDAKTKTVGPKTAKPAIKKSTAAIPAARAAKAAPTRKPGKTR
jgi:hypothetical protein